MNFDCTNRFYGVNWCGSLQRVTWPVRKVRNRQCACLSVLIRPITPNCPDWPRSMICRWPGWCAYGRRVSVGSPYARLRSTSPPENMPSVSPRATGQRPPGSGSTQPLPKPKRAVRAAQPDEALISAGLPADRGEHGPEAAVSAVRRPDSTITSLGPGQALIALSGQFSAF